MSADAGADVAKSMREAARAFEIFNAGLAAFQAAAVRGHWRTLDDERANIHDALDKYLDAFGAAHRRLEQDRREND